MNPLSVLCSRHAPLPGFAGTRPNAHCVRWGEKQPVASPRSEATLGEVPRRGGGGSA